MRFFIALLFAIPCFGTIEENLISTPNIEIHQGNALKGWLEDFSEARKIAFEKQKPLLIAFLGPNWCPWSDQLETEILANEGFMQNLKEDVVFVKIDLPENFEEESFPGKDLKEKYKVNECPALVLVQPSGVAIAKLEYLPIESSEFARYIKQTLSDYNRVSHLEKSELRHMKIDELQYLYSHAGRLADSTFKKVLLDQGLKIDRGPYFLLEQYGNMLASGSSKASKLKKVRNKILARDPKNEQGCIRRLAVLDFEALANVKKPQNASDVVKPLMNYLQKFGQSDVDNAWQLEMKISKYCYTHNQIEDALKHARASLTLAPESAKKDIAHSIEYLQTSIGNTPGDNL